MITHDILGGKVKVYRRPESAVWQCSAQVLGKRMRTSTKERSLVTAKSFAEDWYLTLQGKVHAGEVIYEKTFAEAAKQFEHEYEIITESQRNARYVVDHMRRLRLHLVPFFGAKGLSEITPGLVQEYRVFRKKGETTGRIPSRSTMHHEIVTLRQVMKTAVRHNWIAYLPDYTPPYRSSGKVQHRAWFSPEEYKALYEHTRAKVKNAKGKLRRHATSQLHDFILFMSNTGLRPDEANVLQYRDVEITEDEDTDETILVIEVRGKRGVGYCKSTRGAVYPFKRLLARNSPDPTDLVFPADHKKQFNGVLEKLNLKVDRDGNRRTAYSLRHTYICLRLLEGADIYQVAKNCRTSVEMIEKHYAIHLKNTLDASAINVRR